MDGLKAVNDEQGHLAGDALIKRTAVLLKKTFSSEDVSARLGGDEFGVLMPNTDTAEAENKLAQLRVALGAENQDGKSIPLRISFGLMTVQQRGSLSAGLKQADQRMYQDKATRRTASQGIRVSKEL